MEFNYIISYKCGEVGNTVGCHTLSQARKIAEAIVLYVRAIIGESVEVNILSKELNVIKKVF